MPEVIIHTFRAIFGVWGVPFGYADEAFEYPNVTFGHSDEAFEYPCMSFGYPDEAFEYPSATFEYANELFGYPGKAFEYANESFGYACEAPKSLKGLKNVNFRRFLDSRGCFNAKNEVF